MLVLRREWKGACPSKCLREACEHRQVGVKLDAGEATDAEWAEAVVVLQASELALHGGSATLQ